MRRVLRSVLRHRASTQSVCTGQHQLSCANRHAPPGAQLTVEQRYSHLAAGLCSVQGFELCPCQGLVCLRRRWGRVFICGVGDLLGLYNCTFGDGGIKRYNGGSFCQGDRLFGHTVVVLFSSTHVPTPCQHVYSRLAVA